MIKRLTEKEHWSAIYHNSMAQSDLNNSNQYHKRLRHLLVKILGKKKFNYMIENYKDYIFWQICRQYLPNKTGLKILEIGSAPGTRLINFHKMFGYTPYGIEYTKEGVELNRKIFCLNNINQNNVIDSDFFSEEFQIKYKDYFDIVISCGFIEHFDDVKMVIKKHINLLKKNGICLIAIPRFKGINYLLIYYLNKKCLQRHNLTIMEKNNFSEVFEDIGLLTLYLNYYGTFDFGLLGTEKDSLKRYILKLFDYLQLILNLMFRLLLRKRILKTNFVAQT